MSDPTITLTAQSGKVDVTFHLYGEVSAERYAAEKEIATHRAHQLAYSRPTPSERSRDTYDHLWKN